MATQYPAGTVRIVYTKACCGREYVYEGGSRTLEEAQSTVCPACHFAAPRTTDSPIVPLTHTAEGMVIAALERGVDVEARLAAWNEDEESEEDDW